MSNLRCDAAVFSRTHEKRGSRFSYLPRTLRLDCSSDLWLNEPNAPRMRHDNVTDHTHTSLEASLSHMTRVSTKARSRTTAELDRQPCQRWGDGTGPTGGGLRRRPLRREREGVAGRCCRLLSVREAIGLYLCGKVPGIDTGECWWCGCGGATTFSSGVGHGLRGGAGCGGT